MAATTTPTVPRPYGGEAPPTGGGVTARARLLGETDQWKRQVGHGQGRPLIQPVQWRREGEEEVSCLPNPTSWASEVSDEKRQ